MKEILFNPFRKYAGTAALWPGLIMIALTAVVCYFGEIHLDGVIDLHLGSRITMAQAAGEGLINLVTMSLFCYLSALLVSPSRTRAIDILGTQALARGPFLLASIVSLVTVDEKVLRYIEFTYLNKGVAVELETSDVILFAVATLVTLLSLVWMVLLMYRGYALSANLKGAKGVVSFIVVLIIAEVTSKFLMSKFLI